MQLLTTTRPSEFPADTLQYLRRLAILTSRYCDRVDAEKDEYTRERNYKFAMRCIYRIQKTLYENELAIKDKEARVKVAKVSDDLFDAWNFLNDRGPCSNCNRIGTLAYMAVKCAENFEIYKTPFYYTLSEIKQCTK